MKRVPGRRKPLRRIVAARIIEPSPGTSIRTRLRLSVRDEQVLGKLGNHISRLSGQDLSRAVRGDLTMAERKKLLTAESSARWAGSITRRTDALVALTRRNLVAEIDDKRAAIAKITERLALPSDKGGYAKGAERQKLIVENAEAAYYSGRMLSSQFYIGAEFPKFFGRVECIMGNEGAALKVESENFTGALKE